MKKQHYLDDFDFVSSLEKKEYDVKVDKKEKTVDFVAPYAAAKIYCHATFRKDGKLSRIEVEIQDVYEKYGTAEKIVDWVIGVKNKVSFTWIKKGKICFAFEPKDDVIVFKDFPSDCLSLVDLFVEEMNDYTKMNVSDPFKSDFEFDHALKILKNNKISTLVATIISAAVTIFFLVVIFIQFQNDFLSTAVIFAILSIVMLCLCLYFLSSFLTAKKDYEKVNAMKIKDKNKK